MSTTTLTTVGVKTLADELETSLKEADQALRAAWKVRGQLEAELDDLVDSLLKAGQPAALVEAALRAVEHLLSDEREDLHYSVIDAGELKELVRLAGEQLGGNES